jgi:hypothetical protein
MASLWLFSLKFFCDSSVIPKFLIDVVKIFLHLTGCFWLCLSFFGKLLIDSQKGVVMSVSTKKATEGKLSDEQAQGLLSDLSKLAAAEASAGEPSNPIFLPPNTKKRTVTESKEERDPKRQQSQRDDDLFAVYDEKMQRRLREIQLDYDDQRRVEESKARLLEEANFEAQAQVFAKARAAQGRREAMEELVDPALRLQQETARDRGGMHVNEMHEMLRGFMDVQAQHSTDLKKEVSSALLQHQRSALAGSAPPKYNWVCTGVSKAVLEMLKILMSVLNGDLVSPPS